MEELTAEQEGPGRQAERDSCGSSSLRGLRDTRQRGGTPFVLTGGTPGVRPAILSRRSSSGEVAPRTNSRNHRVGGPLYPSCPTLPTNTKRDCGVRRASPISADLRDPAPELRTTVARGLALRGLRHQGGRGGFKKPAFHPPGNGGNTLQPVPGEALEDGRLPAPVLQHLRRRLDLER